MAVDFPQIWSRIPSVSYTHLDVYKRQDLYSSNISVGNPRRYKFFCNTTYHRFDSVSTAVSSIISGWLNKLELLSNKLTRLYKPCIESSEGIFLLLNKELLLFLFSYALSIWLTSVTVPWKFCPIRTNIFLSTVQKAYRSFVLN